MLRVQDYSLGIRVGVKGSRQRRTFDLRLQPGSIKLVQVRGLRRLGLGLGLGLGFGVMVMV